AKALSDIAKNQRTDEIESVEQIKGFIGEIKKDIAQLNKALLLINSPDGIGLSTPEDIHLSADGQINQYAGDSINLSTQKNYISHALNKMSMFSIQDIALVTAQGKLSIQAQSNCLEVLAKSDIEISSVDGRITIYAPKGVSIIGGSSKIEVEDSGISSMTGGENKSHAGQHVIVDGASVSQSAQLPSSSPLKGALDLVKSYGGQDFFKDTGYKVIDSLGKQITGKLNANGFAQVNGISPGPAKVEFETDPRSAWDQGSHFNRNYTWSEDVVGSATNFAQNTMNSLGQNMMSQLKSNLFSLNGDSLKNFSENALKDLGNQTLGQFKEQFTQSALGSVSSALNLNLSPSQMMNVGKMMANPTQSLQAIKDQGIDFFKDQATALLAQKNSSLMSNLVSNTGFGSSLGQGFMAESLGSGQNAATNIPVNVTEDFIKKDEYFSRFLTYSVTTRKEAKASPIPSVSQSTPAIITQSTTPKSELDADAIRMDFEETRHLTTKVTVRKSHSTEQEIYNARNK
ncbi:MAG: DUF2345 domain-containing protein, partial [Acinetobacter sp.]